jgi:hypothetical protein
MKRKGCGFEYQKERDKDLLESYRRQVAMSGIPMMRKDLIAGTVNSPSKRFWVSEQRAMIIISRMMRGESLRNMTEGKRQMYAEIYRRVMALRDDPKHEGEPLIWLISLVISQPAPSFYLTPRSAITILSNIRRAARCRSKSST